MIMEGALPLVNEAVVCNVKTRVKRSKKDGASSPSNGSAGSLEGSVRCNENISYEL